MNYSEEYEAVLADEWELPGYLSGNVPISEMEKESAVIEITRKNVIKTTKQCPKCNSKGI